VYGCVYAVRNAVSSPAIHAARGKRAVARGRCFEDLQLLVMVGASVKKEEGEESGTESRRQRAPTAPCRGASGTWAAPCAVFWDAREQATEGRVEGALWGERPACCRARGRMEPGHSSCLLSHECPQGGQCQGRHGYLHGMEQTGALWVCQAGLECPSSRAFRAGAVVALAGPGRSRDLWSPAGLRGGCQVSASSTSRWLWAGF